MESWLNEPPKPKSQELHLTNDIRAIPKNGPQASVEHAPTNRAVDENLQYKGLLKRIIIFINIFLAFLISSTGALGIGASKSINDTAVVFVGLYLILFSMIIFFYEIMQMFKVKIVDNFLRRNFGFMYGPLGKGCYVVL
jgi:hypothetical protein